MLWQIFKRRITFPKAREKTRVVRDANPYNEEEAPGAYRMRSYDGMDGEVAGRQWQPLHGVTTVGMETDHYTGTDRVAYYATSVPHGDTVIS
jgi:hypothetical protein